MTTYVKINNSQYPAVITGRIHDEDWDNRETKTIQLKMTYQDIIELFKNDVSWSILQEIEIQEEKIDENNNITFEPKIIFEEYDNSEFSISGPITDNRDGNVTIKMGKYTNEELLLMEVLS